MLIQGEEGLHQVFLLRQGALSWAETFTRLNTVYLQLLIEVYVVACTYIYLLTNICLYGEKHKNNAFMNTEEKAMQTCMLLHAFALPYIFPKNYGQEVRMNYFQHTELTLSRL